MSEISLANAERVLSQAATGSSPRDFTGIVRARAVLHPDKVAFTFLKDGTIPAGSLTYAELDRKACAIAGSLAAISAPGDRALLLFQNGLEFIGAFVACLYAGIVAVPVYPPHSRREYWLRLESLADDCSARFVLGTAGYLTDLDAHMEALSTLRARTRIAVDLEIDPEPGFQPRPHPLAFLQYTSGSTSSPKGVMVTHRNLLHNQRMMQDAFGHRDDSVFVSWLPLFHDMGLIGNVLQSIHVGAHCYIMTPAAFLQKPMRWLQAISDYRANSSFAPNFAYDLCARRGTPEELAGLDLSRWTMALNGAEPIRPETLARFSGKYAPCGFDERAFYPGYGLAEGTLFVTGGGRLSGIRYYDADADLLDRAKLARPAAGGAMARRLVGSGRAWHDTSLIVVDPSTSARCADGAIGEIWVRNDSIAAGYWGREEATEATFQATPCDGPDDDGRYLRTGDLGFLHEGHLFVTGRLKELIILRGANYYPQDIERAVQDSLPCLKQGAGAAVSVEIEGEERLVIIQEVDRTHLRTLDAVGVLQGARQAVLQSIGILPQAVVLIRPGTLAKTSSGKIQRQATRMQFLEGALDVVASQQWPVVQDDAFADEHGAGEAFSGPRDAVAWAYLLRTMIARHQRVHVDAIPATATAVELGLDSMAIAGIQQSVESLGGPNLPLASFFGKASLADLAAALAAATDAGDSVERDTASEDDADIESVSSDWALSDNQRQLWLLHAVAPDSVAYHIPVCLKGGFEIGPLQLAVEALCARHAILRTACYEQDGEARQRCMPSPVDVAIVDAVGESAAEVDARLNAECRVPHDLALGRVLRVTLYRRASGQHDLLFVFHHIAVDLVSIQWLIAEFGVLYAALANGAPLPAAAPGPDYRRFVAAQARHRASAAGARAKAFWRARLDRELPVLQLPIDHPRPSLQTFSGSSFDFSLDARLGERIRLAAQRLGVTASTVLLAAYQVLLSRLSGQSEVMVGVPMSGRHLRGFQNTVGYFVEPAVLHACLPAGMPFERLAQSVQSDLADAFDHQGGVLAAVMERASRHSDRSVPPVFQTLYTFYPATGSGLLPFHGSLAEVPMRLGDMPAAVRPLPSPGAQLDISLLVADDGSGYQVRFEFNTDLFERATVRRFAERYRVLLESVVDDASCAVGRMRLLPHEERELSLRIWNDTAVAYGERRPLHGIIDAYSCAHPDDIAVRCEGRSLSYGDLKRRSDEMARFLSGRGVGVDSCVGIFLHRSLEMMVALLGVLKAGGAYVPVDPDYPPERIRHIVSAAGLSSLLTVTALRDDVLALGVEAVCIDDPQQLATDGSWQAPDIDGRNLAYVIFTSGSTGRPKGVMNTHEAIVNRLVWMQAAYGLQPGEPVLQKTPFSFDVSVWEFFWPLMYGAVVVLARPGGHRDVDYLNEAMRDERITTLHFVPSMLQTFLDGDGLDLPDLRQVICSGEELPAALAARFFERFPNTRLHNLYGPTEAAVDVSQWPCVPGDANPRIPIGHPIANTRLYVLDGEGQPVPVGVPGELYIGGMGLARGYLGRPDLTAERFVPDAWSGGAGERLYRTGDVARFRADGAIEYLGRTDHQVKLRGFRIELGEVEAALTQLPGVREAVVVVRGEGAGKVLLGYVSGEGLEASALKAGLERRLPGYMVPSALKVLDALPQTPNGKVDRQGLPAIEVERGEEAQRAPQTRRERAIAAVWCEVLGLASVGIGESFFDLGGHSLLAAKLVAKLRGSEGLALRVRDVFEAPTVAAQAQRAQRLADAELPLVPVARGEDAPLSFAQQRLWFLAQLEGANATYNMPHAVRLRGALDAAALRASVTGLVDRHEVLRTVYGYRDGQPRQQVRPVGTFEPGWEDWSDRDAATRDAALAARVQAECGRAFDLANDLPLRVSLLRLDAQDHVLVLCLHHIAGDGWSVEVLWRELEAGYRAALSGQPAPAEPAVQYIDYAHWQQAWLSGPRHAEQLDYWRNRLDGAPPLLELPTDRPRPAVQRYEGASVPVSIPDEWVASIRELGRTEQASVFMTLLAVFQVVLSRYSGQEDIVVGSPVANRPRDELDGLIGFFANTLMLRSRVRPRQSFRSLLGEVRETTLAAYEHQDVPFEQLVEALQPARSLSHSPLFQVMFNLQHGGAETIALPEVDAEVLASDTQVAKFDLTLTLQDRAGRLDGTLEYNTDLFEAGSIERLWRHYVSVLGQVLEDQDRSLGRLDLLTEEERTQYAAWNATGAWYPPDACLHTLFEAQAAKTPEALAVVCDAESLSYGELNARANRLAHALRAQGVAPETTVGVCLPRSPELLVSLLAILKAGGAYVPLDPQYPTARLAHILDNATPRVVLTDMEGRERLAELVAQGTTLSLPDAHRGEPTGATDRNPVPSADPACMAYVIYTSGSTGRPKGVAITHANAVAMLAWATREFAGDDLRHTLASTSICFDLSVFELFLPLATGHTVVLVRDALAMIDRPPALPVSLINTVPSAMEALLEAGALPSSVRVVNLAGEALSRSLVDKLYACEHIRAVYNLYGPSEDTTYSTGCRVERDGIDAPSIGRPIENTRAFVLDDDLMPVPVGVKGELYLAGAGLSRGYLGQPDLTAERYVPNPFADTPGERLYRTGDIVRHMPDGRLAYLGRSDHQIKLRGFRIELGEIESVIAACPGVREAIAMVRKIGGGVETLVAFLHAEEGSQTTDEAMRTAMIGLLPDYMIPSQLIFLEAMPLTANGKIDRKALRDLPVNAVADSAYAPPANETEMRLAEIWQEVLGIARVGRNDDFFAAGGHSLLATALNMKILAAFAVRTTVRDVFLHPRLSQMAECIDNLHWMAASAAGARDRNQAIPDQFEVGVL